VNQQTVPDADRRPRLVVRKDRVVCRYVIFGGWGPKMMALALAASAFAIGTGRSDAATVSTQHGLCVLGMAPPVLADSQAPGWPDNSLDLPDGGTVTVRVRVDTSAHITQTAIEKSSGDFWLDREARRVVSGARLAPSDASCKTEPGDYAFVVNFVPPGQ